MQDVLFVLGAGDPEMVAIEHLLAEHAVPALRARVGGKRVYPANAYRASVPPQAVVWTLRTAQFTGREIFTMAGEARFVKAVEFAGQRLHPQPPAPEGQDRGVGRKSSLRVVK